MNISKVSKKLNLTPNTLRYYEEEKLIPPVSRDVNGYRNYTEYDLNWIYFVKSMRKAGMSVEAIKMYTKLFLEDRYGSIAERKKILIKEQSRIRQEVDELQKSLIFLNHKIDIYDGKFQFAEDKLDPYIQKDLELKGDVDDEDNSV